MGRCAFPLAIGKTASEANMAKAFLAKITKEDFSAFKK
jgi:hypothetical protein